MRIVFFDFVTHYGGAPRNTVELAKRLSEHVEVSIVDAYGCCREFADAVREAKLDWHVLFPTYGSRIVGGHGRALHRAWRMLRSAPDLLKIGARLKNVLNELDPSVVCVNGFKSAGMVGASYSLRRIPLIMYMHGWCLPDTIPAYGRWLCRRRCSAVFAVSHATKAAVMCSGIDPGKIHVLHNAVDVDGVVAQAERPADMPLPGRDAAVRILLPASINPGKGQHTAVKALKRIQESGHDAVLWLAGDVAFDLHEAYSRETHALAERLGVAERVQWLGSRCDIPQLMRASTIVVLPSHTEGLGRVILEAMSLGKPVAATPVGGIQDIIAPNLTGLFFEVDDDVGLARCVEQIVREPSAAEHMGRLAEEYMRLNFSPATQTETALEVFRSVAANRSTRACPDR